MGILSYFMVLLMLSGTPKSRLGTYSPIDIVELSLNSNLDYQAVLLAPGKTSTSCDAEKETRHWTLMLKDR